MSVVEEIEQRRRRALFASRPRLKKLEPKFDDGDEIDLCEAVLKIVGAINEERVRREREWEELPTEIKVLLDRSISHSAFCPE